MRWQTKRRVTLILPEVAEPSCSFRMTHLSCSNVLFAADLTSRVTARVYRVRALKRRSTDTYEAAVTWWRVACERGRTPWVEDLLSLLSPPRCHVVVVGLRFSTAHAKDAQCRTVNVLQHTVNHLRSLGIQPLTTPVISYCNGSPTWRPRWTRSSRSRTRWRRRRRTSGWHMMS